MKKLREKRVGAMPLQMLWNDAGVIAAKRGRYLDPQEVETYIEGHTEFVIADIGLRLEWIPVEMKKKYWETEWKTHIAPTGEDGFSLDEFQGHYAYVVSVWKTGFGAEVILMEKFH
ncbi:MAG: hypothetical protein ACT6QS_04450 [Flavobacteriales bacterium]